ncbi:hypothetical protein BZJ19_06520 [Salinivibrio proteolyticus]|uniref:DUF1107 domain-containing protein n=1 Tax=Salinivibrio TaxID=51366 RepID=UPI000988EE17|nr:MULTISPECIES: DUF1107 domain-containing protein [Salinivibrio]OOF11490.1 hypothetical protein BZG82_04405 [Salinivibrio sp. PR5]OOF26180.1 hypothetical protein BZJ19_06520 [Salinivibrio proteolyticus]OOF31416.1 hypothetical protein BZJ20_05060 [Salinivibrio proteolyticus]
MRVFNRYVPRLVAKHVARLFSGRLYIAGRGRFDFENGWLKAPQDATITHYQTVKEVNAVIREAYQQAMHDEPQPHAVNTHRH